MTVEDYEHSKVHCDTRYQIEQTQTYALSLMEQIISATVINGNLILEGQYGMPAESEVRHRRTFAAKRQNTVRGT